VYKDVEVKVFMKKIILLLAILLLLISGSRADACVGRVLFIGSLQAPHEQLLSEMLSVLINERTGTTVNIKYYENSKELYDALKRNEIGIIVENTDRAIGMLGKKTGGNGEKDYGILKEEFRKNLALVWLEPFGYLTSHKNTPPQYYGPVITEDVLVNFPALPRVINKLSGVVTDKTLSKMILSMESGEKPQKIARDFLKAKKLI
jgi:osmoprotectant transport system substrate-binding protein